MLPYSEVKGSFPRIRGGAGQASTRLITVYAIMEYSKSKNELFAAVRQG